MKLAGQGRFQLLGAMLIVVGLALLVWSRPTSTAPRKNTKVKVDYMALASILIRDGHTDRAAAALSKVNLKDKKLDRAQYHVLQGIVASKRKDHRGVIRHLGEAIRRGKKKAMLHLLVAQSHFRLKQYKSTLAALARAGDLSRTKPMAVMFAANSHWRLGQKARAWSVLDRGVRRFPKHREMARQKIMLLVELTLYQQAAEEGRRFLDAPDTTLDDHLAVAEAFHRAGQHRAAILILEGALLARPNQKRLMLRLALAHVKAGQPLAAATLVHRAAYQDPKLRLEAAELYRRARKLTLALLVNAQVLDQRAKLRQRLGLLIEAQRFEEAAALELRLSRLGLLKDQQLLYALAYSYFRIGRFRRAERWLKHVTKPGLFRKAIELRRSMATCESQGWMCQQ